MTDREVILKDIEKFGVFHTEPGTNDSILSEIDLLVEENILESVYNAGIDFMNSSWSYIRKDNPDNIGVITKHNMSWLGRV